MPPFNSIIIYVISPLIISIVTFTLKSIYERLARLEEKMQSKPSDLEVRQLLSDKYDPLALDIKEIKEMQQKLFDLYVQTVQKI
jgi:hypothetical protein